MNPDDPRWADLSGPLAEERKGASFMSLLLDEDLIRRATEHPARRALDYGAGTGALAFAIARSGTAVDAFEPTPSQHALLTEAAQERPSARVRPLAAEDEVTGGYDLILCVNVLDHVADYEAAIGRLSSWSIPGGRLLLVLPHPLKDFGDWHREPPDGDASSYRHYVLHDYVREGPCLKIREDRLGRVVARDVPSHHRTISSYFNALRRNGFEVTEMVEPAPDRANSETQPILYAKSSRIPYFLLFNCRRLGDPARGTTG